MVKRKTHSITDHKTVEEVLIANMHWEDSDTMLQIAVVREDGGFSGSTFWKQRWSNPKEAVIEMIYEIYGPECRCGEFDE